jgi:hypothetical protein
VQLFPVYHDSVEAIQVWQDIDGELLPLANKDADGVSIAAVVARPHAGHPAIAAFVHPCDQSDADFSVEGTSEVGTIGITMLRLFDRFMEKGVIRRARLRMLLSPSSIDDDALFKHYQHFANSRLPLTT